MLRRFRIPMCIGSILALVLLAACSHGGAPTARRSSPSVKPPQAYSSPSTKAAAGRPNIVFVLTDDLSNNLVAQMPPVLELEREGTTFSHYYVVDSLCCPSRAAIFTGEYPHDDHVYTNGPPFGGYSSYQKHSDAKHSFALDLQQQGYTTAFMGKYLNGYFATDPVPPGWNVWDGVDEGGYQEFNYNMNVNGVSVHYGDADKDYLTQVLSKKARSFISSASKQRNPFFLEVATFAPHEPFIVAPKYRGTAAGALYPETPAYNAQVKNPPPWLHQRPPLSRAEREHMFYSYRMRIEDDYSVDDLIKNIEAGLTKAGDTRNTYVVFSSDNGYHMGEYRLTGGKQTAFDTDISVPLVIAGPHVPADRTVNAMTSNIDLAPTFDGLAHADVDPKADGVSLLPWLFGGTPQKWQQAVLVEHHGPDDSAGDPDAQSQKQADPPSYEAIRTAGALYVVYKKSGFEEYYNTESDPYELDNLGGNRAPRFLKVALKRLEHCHRSKACQAAAIQPFKSKH